MSAEIFISYSKKDSEFSKKLADDLIMAGFQIWMDRSIGGGERWRETIENNLKDSKEVIIVVSPNSMASDWVRHEGSLAYGWGKKLYPVLIAPVTSLPPWIEEYQWVSFVDTSYKVAFASLVAALTPPNPIQDLLDEQVKVYRQTEQLLGEEILSIINKARNTLTISSEAEELIQKSTLSIEARHQKEVEQKRALAEAKTRQDTTQKRSRRAISFLIISFIIVALVSIASTFPVSTGWHKFHSFDTIIETGKSPDKFFITMDASNSDKIYVSDYTPGGLYKSTFDNDTCWSKIDQIPNTQAIVTHITAGEGMIYIITSDGLLSSDDDGTSWKPLQLTTEPNTLELTAIAINPVNPLQVFVGTTPNGLFITENGGKDWSSAILPKFSDDAEVWGLAYNGHDLLLATEQSIWISKDHAASWKIAYDRISPIYGLAMVGNEGRFFIARGDLGIGDADVDSNQIRVLADSPPAGFIYSVSASRAARNAASKEGIWYWRLWPWTNINWLFTRLGFPVPCY